MGRGGCSSFTNRITEAIRRIVHAHLFNGFTGIPTQISKGKFGIQGRLLLWFDVLANFKLNHFIALKLQKEQCKISWENETL